MQFQRYVSCLVASLVLFIAVSAGSQLYAQATEPPMVGDEIINPITDETEIIAELLDGTGQAVTEAGNVVFLHRTIGATFTDADGVELTVVNVIEREHEGLNRITQVEISDGTNTRLVETVKFEPKRGGLYINPFSADVETVSDARNGTVLTEDGDILRFKTNSGDTYKIGDQDFTVVGTETDSQGRVVALNLSNNDAVDPRTVRLDRVQGKPTVEGKILNPSTGLEETISEIKDANYVETYDSNVFAYNTKVGDAYNADGGLLFVNAQNTVAGGVLDSIQLTDYAETPFTDSLQVAVYSTDDGSGNTPGLDEREITVTAPAGNSNQVSKIRIGGDGDDGRDGFGVSETYTYYTCEKWAVLWCEKWKKHTKTITVAYKPLPGEPGEKPDDIVRNIRTSHGDIETTSANLPGVSLVSIGGDGGNGGDAFGNIKGREGGEGGTGGDILAFTEVQINTSGDGAHGVYVLSGAGDPGDGGDGYIASDSASGGDGGKGGDIAVEHGENGRIFTSGNRAHGITARSTGGSGGTSGDSYGIIGIAGGGGSEGGNGGSVKIENRGYIQTSGTSSKGIVAQSLGGDGGDKGDVGGIVAVGNTDTDAGGGDGGKVNVINAATGTIRTSGAYSTGILAQSIGGGGGDGGVSAGLVAIGSAGTAGGDGGEVRVTTEAGSQIVTMGSSSHGIKAQSIGGGGGTGGTTGSAFTSVGSSGGGGSDGGSVIVRNGGLLRTNLGSGVTRQEYEAAFGPFFAINPDAEFTISAPASKGIIAQSIGGGGGSAEGTGALVSIGGSGGAGGDGGRVIVENSGRIETASEGGTAVTAQSIGGGGGLGSLSIGIVGVGGKGEAAGDGGEVTVENTGSIETKNNFAKGVLAQSIGGGGGAGGIGAGVVGIGGESEAGGVGRDVTVVNSGLIKTEGSHATAIHAQSIGGGGGTGGTSGGLVSVGGKAGGAGDASNVTVENSGTIVTEDYGSRGIMAQSIGGGGGDGGNAYSGGLFYSVAVGADGETGGSAGDVDIKLRSSGTNVSRIETKGARSDAIFAQAIGGGGGSGGHSVGVAASPLGAVAVSVGGSGDLGGDAGEVNIDGVSNVITRGQESNGISALSIGGGGGTGGSSIAVGLSAGPISGAVSVAVGGSGGAGGAGADVNIDAGGSITTLGRGSNAIKAQSIGGGGGNGNMAIGASASFGAEGSLSVGKSVGGSGGAGGDAATVSTKYNGFIETQADDSDAVFLQSIGGGGGTGGLSVDSRLSVAGTFTLARGAAVGGQGDSGGDGKSVIVDLQGGIKTRGNNSAGLVGQSIGGGGGKGGLSIASAVSGGVVASGAAAVSVGGSGGNGGDGGSVSVTTRDFTLETEGARSTGMRLSSIGGGGGSGDFSIASSLSLAGTGSGSVRTGIGGSGGSGGDGGNVTLNFSGHANTTPDNYAFDLKSVGGGGGRGSHVVSSGLSISTVGSGNVGLGIGGSGGSGGAGGNVEASVAGNITGATRVQSIGGGGGAGGFNISSGFSASALSGNVNVGIGGSGGGGGSAGSVTASHTGDALGSRTVHSIGGGGGDGAFNVTGGMNFATNGGGNLTFGLGGAGGAAGEGGDVASMVIGNLIGASSVQSIGGGGGSGGFNVSGGLSASAFSGNVNVGIGGSGGGGGSAGSVTASHTGDALGSRTVHSIGGGGGDGSFNVTGGMNIASNSGGNVSVGLGGAGAAAGDGGDVSSTVVGNTFGSTTVKSIGGGGGSGGFNVSGGANVALNGAGGNLGFGLGGFGGGGGDSGDVTSKQFGTTLTRTYALQAMSIGGGGGAGDFNITGGLTYANAASGNGSIGIGGFGGDGGSAGKVSAYLNGDALYAGEGRSIVEAASIGGGGGSGAFNISGGLALSETFSGSLTFGLGGAGGLGGDGGGVQLVSLGHVIKGTDLPSLDFGISEFLERYAGEEGGTLVNAIKAQSIGGGGGDGAFNISGGISLGNPETYSSNINLGVGGSSGAGGRGDDVDLTVAGRVEGCTASPCDLEKAGRAIVTAKGQSTKGVVAQSIGGGGGSGGFNVTGGFVAGNSIGLGVGGAGGSGNTAGAVTADVDADIYLMGEFATGIVAESIGGGGGDGGFNLTSSVGGSDSKGIVGANLNIGVGGDAGDGNTADNVTLKQAGNISLISSNGTGIVAQSIGGGGGTGGFNASGLLTLSGRSPSFAAGVGGSGGSGATAGDVFVASDGNITMRGLGDDLSGNGKGILAQSIGGGGGNAGMNLNVNLNFDSPVISTNLTVGGTGGDAAHGGAVTLNRGLTTPGEIIAQGDNSWGILAQSIGGGGGNAGMNIGLSASGSAIPEKAALATKIAIGGGGGAPGHGDTVNVNHVGNISTNGERSHGLMAQSVGGGGGNAAVNFNAGVAKDAGSLSFALGGQPGAGGEGDDVRVNHIGKIITLDHDSYGIFAQSTGGGGGNAAMNSAFNAGGALDVGYSLGRRGGAGGKAGTVHVASDGLVSTSGNTSTAIFAQSAGNGGGVSSAVSSSVLAGEALGVSASVGLEGGEGGTGGGVAVDASGILRTKGRESHGIHAQSVGGGGGVGGLAFAPSLNKAFSVSTSIGGIGGKGAVSGSVSVETRADIQTEGTKSHGVFAQSVGGAGGVGGLASVINFKSIKEAKPTADAKVSIGGNGGEGAEGGSVSVRNAGQVVTRGDQSYGIFAESVGGGGGAGGATLNFNLTNSAGQSNQLGLAIGGTGGLGGKGLGVTVENNAVVATFGKEAHGIFAQSVGGGGGNGGLVSELSGNVASSSGSVNVNIGGDGNSGGTGGEVRVVNKSDGNIFTRGEKSYGIFAQSVGGGGGYGGAVLSGRALRTTGNHLEIGVNLGGKGGSGNSGDDVDVRNEGTISTIGDNSHGIFAQSVGGGGGVGGFVAAAQASNTWLSPVNTAFILGGFGGDGGNGGDVYVKNEGDIYTRGDNAHGIKAQSVGGGGGDNNMGLGVGSLTTTVASNAIALKAGGVNRSEGGVGGDVTIDHLGSIDVIGDGAEAVVAESINGGGGGFVMNFDNITSLEAGASLPEFVQDAIGGDNETTKQDTEVRIDSGSENSKNAEAGKVTVNLVGKVTSRGEGTTLVRNQSIGGGGGTQSVSLSLAPTEGLKSSPLKVSADLGSQSGENNRGRAVNFASDGVMGSEGANTMGALVQSIGGGGGLTKLRVDAQRAPMGEARFSLGSTDGQDETAGELELARSGGGLFKGNFAVGVTGQSIGGGGGVLSYKVTEGANASDAQGVVLSLGSEGSMGAEAGSVRLKRQDDLRISGDQTVGVLLQSIGGGGGAAVIDTQNRTLDIRLGGADGSTGAASAINFVSTGVIQTQGDHSHGIVAQSIGGGGGFVLHNSDKSQTKVSTSSATSGNGGAISLQIKDAVAVSGEQSVGILAQSLGGGGGFVSQKGAVAGGGEGNASNVDLEIDAVVLASGAQSTAVMLQSEGQTNGDITMAIGSGSRVLAEKGSTAIAFMGGDNNRIENQGEIFAETTAQGVAVQSREGNLTIANRGTLSGNIKLGKGENRLENTGSSARLHLGREVDLGGVDNSLINSGTITVGTSANDAAGMVSQLNGRFESTQTALLNMDVRFVDSATKTINTDKIVASGEAQLGGKLQLSVSNYSEIAPGVHYLKFFETQGGSLTSTLSLDAPGSIVTKYALAYPTAKEAAVALTVDFAADGLQGHSLKFGEYINRMQLVGGSDATADLIAGVATLSSFDALDETYSAFDGAVYGQNLSNSASSAAAFSSALFSCPGVVAAQDVLKEHPCAWSKSTFTHVERFANATMSGSKSNMKDWTFGWQRELPNGGFMGIGGSVTNGSMSVGGSSKSFVEGYRIGGTYKQVIGKNKLSFAAVLGHDSYNISRSGMVLGTPTTFSAKQKLTYLGLRGRLQHQIDMTYGAIIPEVGLAGMFYQADGFTETSSGQNALEGLQQSGSTFAANVGVTLASKPVKTQLGELTASMYLGAQYNFSDIGFSTRLADTPTSVDPVTSSANRDRLEGQFGVNALFKTSESTTLSISAQSKFSENSRSLGGSIKFSFMF